MPTEAFDLWGYTVKAGALLPHSKGLRRIWAVDVGWLFFEDGWLRFIYCGEDCVDFGAFGREGADGVGGGGIASQRHGLAAAAAKVLMAAVARFAGFLHPIFPTKLLERRGIFPDFLQ